ncbi:hypothetical protein FNF29_08264 [Cafeteria roenbergensis]|uniref:Copper transport protein n=1 Tax=Cafeteria roenbergensis TaxID=33653 RepID=A0A5A8BZE2_CAFRO|nr:hypothetical protein FNF29_08264 [Cafeteria roenbergensis]|eukprot:KAA0146076.1 hypothetical protein FNF29_08264 [Cafeteria roenbergensis]
MAEPSLGAAGTVLRFSNPMTNDEHDVVRFTEAEGAVTDGDSHTAVSYFPGYSLVAGGADPSWSLAPEAQGAASQESTNPKYFHVPLLRRGPALRRDRQGASDGVQYLCCKRVHNAIIAVDEPDVCSYKVQDALLSRRKPGLIADYRSHPAVARIAVVVDAVLALAVGIIGAFNMLILMTMNWGLFLGVCVGEVVGMVIFDPAVPMSDWQARLAGGTGDVDTCH